MRPIVALIRSFKDGRTDSPVDPASLCNGRILGTGLRATIGAIWTTGLEIPDEISVDRSSGAIIGAMLIFGIKAEGPAGG
jgi:hypothetical protein